MDKKGWIEFNKDLIFLFLIIFASFYVISVDYTGFVIDNSSSNETIQDNQSTNSTSNLTNSSIVNTTSNLNLTNSTIILNQTNTTILNLTNTSLSSNVTNITNKIPDTLISVTFTSQLVLKKDEGRHFSIDNVKHTITVTDVVDGFVILSIQSDLISLGLSVGETKEIDLNNDGKSDLKVEILKINPDGSAIINLVNIPDVINQPVNIEKPTVPIANDLEEPKQLGGFRVKKDNELVIFGGILGFIVLVLILVIILFMRRKTKSTEDTTNLVEPLLQSEEVFENMSDQY